MSALRIRNDLAGEAVSTSELRVRSLVDAHFDFVWRSLRGLGVPQSSVDDAAQQVLLIASQKVDAIERGRERSFLFATARGIAANERRSRARRREVIDDELACAEIDGSPDPETAYSKMQAHVLLERIMESMDESSRTVFVLFELEGLTMIEIATMIGAPLGTVASRLRRARSHFQIEAAKLRAEAR